jgi:LysR family transcriptional regulator, regulator of abg operon
MAEQVSGDMNIEKLERMVAVYEAGSFRKAAKRLGMTQPALTWSIKQLEDSLNIRLFDRGPRGIQPTHICDRLVTRARLIISEEQKLIVDAQKSVRTRTISIGAHPNLLHDGFAETVCRFRELHPDLTLKIIEGFSAHLVENLQRGSLDLAVCALPVEGEFEQDLKFFPMMKQRFFIAGRHDHPVFHSEIETRDAFDWAQVDTPNIKADDSNELEIYEQLEKAGMKGTASVRTSSMNFVKSLVSSGAMLGMIADTYVEDEISSGDFKIVPGTTVEAPTIGLVTVRDSLETEPLRKLKSLLRQNHNHLSQDPPAKRRPKP